MRDAASRKRVCCCVPASVWRPRRLRSESVAGVLRAALHCWASVCVRLHACVPANPRHSEVHSLPSRAALQEHMRYLAALRPLLLPDRATEFERFLWNTVADYLGAP